MSETSLGNLDVGKISNTVAEASEADLGVVTESMTKAAQTRAQIKDMQQQNATDAFLLMLLFKYVQDDELIHFVFGRVVKEGVSIRAMFAHFLPMLYQAINAEKLVGIFDQEIALFHSIELNVVGYVSYIKGLQTHYPETKDIDHEKYIEFVRQILAVYGLIDWVSMDEEKKKEFLGILAREI